MQHESMSDAHQETFETILIVIIHLFNSHGDLDTSFFSEDFD